MTRNEEIQKRIDEETGIDNYGSSDYQIGVCDGVRLADKTMIEKVCNWIDENARGYLKAESNLVWFDSVSFRNDLRKAMEEWL